MLKMAEQSANSIEIKFKARDSYNATTTCTVITHIYISWMVFFSVSLPISSMFLLFAVRFLFFQFNEFSCSFDYHFHFYFLESFQVPILCVFDIVALDLSIG